MKMFSQKAHVMLFEADLSQTRLTVFGHIKCHRGVNQNPLLLWCRFENGHEIFETCMVRRGCRASCPRALAYNDRKLTATRRGP